MDYQAIIESLFRGLIGERFIVFALAAIGLNLHFGYTGLLNFGQAVFMAAGAYGLAMMVATVGPRLNENTGLNMSETTLFWVGVFTAVVVFPILFALVMGIPTLRLRADYLAIVTIAVAEIFRIVARSPRFDWLTGSSDGLTGFSGTCEELERECGITLSYVAAVGDRCATHSHARARTRAHAYRGRPLEATGLRGRRLCLFPATAFCPPPPPPKRPPKRPRGSQSGPPAWIDG